MIRAPPPVTLPAPTAPSYTIFLEDGIYWAEDGITRQRLFRDPDPVVVIQEAFSALTPGRTWEETIELKGRYILKDTINIPSFTRLRINGTLEAHSTLANKPIIQSIGAAFGDGNGNTHIVIEGGRIDGKGLTGVDGIFLQWTWRTKIIGVDIRNCRDGISVFQSEEEEIVHNKIGGCSRRNIYFEGTSAARAIAFNEIHHAGESGIYLGNDVGDTPIIGNTFYGSGKSIQLFGAREIRIVGNGFADTTLEPHIVAYNSHKNIIAANRFLNPAGTNPFIKLDGAQFNRVVHNLLFDIRTPKQSQAVVELGTADFNLIAENHFDVASPAVSKVGANTRVFGNTGWLTENKGTATIAAGTTSVTVAHGLAGVPSKVVVTPRGNMGAVWVSARDATNITINVATAPAANTLVDWEAEL
jgi:hypothetical protein